MASFLSSSLHLGNHSPHFRVRRRKFYEFRAGSMAVKASLEDSDARSQKSTRLVTFLGKGGSGKTTSAVFAAQHYANSGLYTCLVIHGQDSTAEHLLDCKIGNSPVVCSENLSALRLESTKMILDPLDRLKQADSCIKMTQGILEGIVGEELGVLPGMDSIFTALALGRFLGFLKILPLRNDLKDRFDIIVYDGLSTEEILRLIGAASKARFTRVGSVVLALHDATDVFLEIGKMSKYGGYETIASCSFVLFVLLWTLFRLIFYPFWVLWSTSYEVILTLDMDKYSEEGPIYYYVFNTLLFILLVLNIYWGILMYRMLAEQIKSRGKVSDDVRSDFEEEHED